ncbi:RNA ligase family protein [Kitasatospora paracochleata]|uniref:Kinase n=2 Tax=Kitasatospora paracochleata TaxID=58354 RepID=A0ABT1J1E5_9ACTN|nr:RNA ligase family protein [Kitasatospora paracochleata]MCP2310979.1 putative kinase [Kitasatospora paracochleata]
MRVSYPRTPHLPWSPGASADDVRSGGLDGLRGREVVVTEKLDGENTTLYRDGLHARSLDSGHHPARAWVKGLQGRIGPLAPAGWRVCGENMFARHSIAYRELDSWFYGFSVWDATDRCLGWDDTVRFLRRLGVPAPRVLWRGTFDERALRALRFDTERVEGYVVRTVEGFAREEFGLRVAKWVRPQHVQTDTHWMHAAVVENGLGPAAALWAVRSGAPADLPALLAAAGLDPAVEVTEAAGAAVEDVCARLDVLGRRGDARLAGVLAAALPGSNRARLAASLAGPLGMPLARRVADLVGLHPALQRPYPDEDRRAGLVRLAVAADLGVLHAVAAAVPAGRADAEAADAREQAEWSALHAEDAGLLGEAPLAALRTGLGEALAELGPDAADRCWAEAREAFALGRVTGVEDAVAAAWRWRSGAFPHLVQLVGPSGSGKSVFADGLPATAARISLDALREERGDRSDQRANADILRAGLDRLDAALARGGTVVWDATSLNRQQRSLVQGIAQRRDALVTQVVLLVGKAELVRRNTVRPHPVPSGVLAAQLRRFGPPYAGEAHRTWYVGEAGAVEDTAGTIGGEDA